jgi:hypothetical protein
VRQLEGRIEDGRDAQPPLPIGGLIHRQLTASRSSVPDRGRRAPSASRAARFGL